MSRRVFLCTQSLYGSRGASVRWAELDDSGWVDGETPVEDFGMWFVTDREIGTRAAERILIALMGHDEGEEPEVGHLSDDERLFRSHRLPTLLEPEEFDIYQKLLTKS